MQRVLFLLGLVATTVPAFAAEPARTPECGVALKALADVEQAIAARPPAAREEAAQRLRALQRDAAKVCLGPAAASAPRPSARAQPPVVVPSVRVPPPNLPALRAPAPPVVTARPPTRPWITSCDAGGCWGSDGTRYPRQAGQTLQGPNGLCTQQGLIVSCP